MYLNIQKAKNGFIVHHNCPERRKSKISASATALSIGGDNTVVICNTLDGVIETISEVIKLHE